MRIGIVAVRELEQLVDTLSQLYILLGIRKYMIAYS